MPYIPREIFQLLSPLMAPITFGFIFFLLSWLYPRRIVSLPGTGRRAALLTGAGIAGGLFVALLACVLSVTRVANQGGYEDWWRRPAPLLAATLVVAVVAVVAGREPRPAAGEAAITPRRSWYAFAPRPLLRMTAVVASLLGLTALWQTAIGTTAPEEGPFFGNVAEYSELPIYMAFSSNFGFIGGVGWPNHLATLLAIALALLVLIATLRADANRPMFARMPSASVREERELTARLCILLLLGGLVVTVGAVWMHAGSIGSVLVGIDDGMAAERGTDQTYYFGSRYDVLARPLNIAGHIAQGLGVALLLRVAIDTARAASRKRQMEAPTLDGAAQRVGAER